MNRTTSFAAGILVAFFLLAAPAVAQTPPAAKPAPAPAMERTEHQWQGGQATSTFGAHWMGAELKMIREEMAPRAGMIEKNEFFFNQGALLHYKQDRYPEPGKKGESVALMVSFDKTGKPSMSLKRIDGNPAGPASASEIEQAKKHLAELLLITGKVKR